MNHTLSVFKINHSPRCKIKGIVMRRIEAVWLNKELFSEYYVNVKQLMKLKRKILLNGYRNNNVLWFIMLNNSINLTKMCGKDENAKRMGGYYDKR